MNKSKRFPLTNIGTVSLLMIFIVLCMVTFAALSLSESARDLKFSQKLAAHTTEYYKASNQAEEVLPEITPILKQCSADYTSESDYYTAVANNLPDRDSISLKAEGATISYQVQINDSHALAVSIRMNAPKEITAGNYYQITSWKEIQTSEWEADNSLHLINQ